MASTRADIPIKVRYCRGRPGELPPMPRLPVFYALLIEDWMRVPTQPPREPGLYCLVYLDDEHTRALGWLQGRSR
jgi:hypothetical protein